MNKMLKACLITMLGIACVDIQGPEMEKLASNDILSQVKISSSAIMIAKGDSHSIAIGVYAMNGNPIPIDPDSIQWSSADAQAVSVSPTGTIYGLKVSSSPVRVIVTYRYKYVTKSDTVPVWVTDGVIDANSVRLVALDSNRVGLVAAGPVSYPRVRVDLYKDMELVEQGTAAIPIEVDKPFLARVDLTGGPNKEPVYRISGSVSIVGRFWVRASMNLYGNEVKDSLLFTGLYQGLTGFNITTLPADQTPSITVLDTLPLNLYQRCSVVQIYNLSSDTIDVMFSDSTAPSIDCAGLPQLSILLPPPFHGTFIGGNVLSIPPSYLAQRQSATQGVIVYRVRKSSTKEFLPYFTGHYKQLDPDE